MWRTLESERFPCKWRLQLVRQVGRLSVDGIHPTRLVYKK